jgi:hypothetical protein
MNIQMNNNGSGKLTMEYRVSKLINSLGALDGNESMPTIPVGRTDWDRTIDRIPGAKIASFSSVEEKQDYITNIVIVFKDEQSLLALLDPLLERTSLNIQDQSGRLEMIILDDFDSIDVSSYGKDFMDMVRVFWEGYNFTFSFTGPENSTLTITDRQGNTIPAQAAAQTTLSGKNVSYSIGIMDLMEIKNGLGLKFNW